MKKHFWGWGKCPTFFGYRLGAPFHPFLSKTFWLGGTFSLVCLVVSPSPKSNKRMLGISEAHTFLGPGFYLELKWDTYQHNVTSFEFLERVLQILKLSDLIPPAGGGDGTRQPLSLLCPPGGHKSLIPGGGSNGKSTSFSNSWHSWQPGFRSHFRGWLPQNLVSLRKPHESLHSVQFMGVCPNVGCIVRMASDGPLPCSIISKLYVLTSNIL